MPFYAFYHFFAIYINKRTVKKFRKWGINSFLYHIVLCIISYAYLPYRLAHFLEKFTILVTYYLQKSPYRRPLIWP